MQQKNIEELLIRHCNNLHRLSVEQLQAIREEKENVVTELTAQKQIILDSLAALQEQFEIQACRPEIQEQVMTLLRQIVASENEGQQIIKERCTSISKEMLANRKEMNIQQAYEETSFQIRGNLCNIEK